MEKEIKYIGAYDTLREGKQYRVYSLAAAKKMDFICTELNKIGYYVRIISPAHVTKMGCTRVPQVCEQIRDDVLLELPASFEARNKAERIIRVLEAKIWLFFYLIKHTHIGEPVIVYHNYNYALPVCLAQKIKKFRIILEVEEIYANVWKLSSGQKWKEKLLLKYADNKSLVVSDALARELMIQSPNISYGAYTPFPGEIKRKCTGEKICLVLTGLVDRERGNGFLAVDTMRYLPEKYQLKISGPVAEKDRTDFLSLINQVNKSLGRKACEYLGVLDNREYEQLLLSADIALNPQKDGDFGTFLFPSKILTYFSYGLPVVSTRGDSIVQSKLADLITFADGFDGQSVAGAIERVEVREPSLYQHRLAELEREFSEKLRDAIEGM